MFVYDTIDAYTIEPGDQVLVNDVDPIEVKRVSEDGEAILVEGWSHVSGDTTTYILDPDARVGLWYV